MYTQYLSPIYRCFLDANKAFDKLHHWILFQKIKQHGCPVYLVKLLIYWYQKQKPCKVGYTFSVSNGIKQGGILSPMLFNIYVDNLSTALKKCNAGCCFNTIVLNHLYYADNLCLLSPSLHGLNELLSISAKYVTDHDTVFNDSKSVCLYIKPLHFKKMPVNSIYLNGVRIKIESDNKLQYTVVLWYIKLCKACDRVVMQEPTPKHPQYLLPYKKA